MEQWARLHVTGSLKMHPPRWAGVAQAFNPYTQISAWSTEIQGSKGYTEKPLSGKNKPKQNKQAFSGLFMLGFCGGVSPGSPWRACGIREVVYFGFFYFDLEPFLPSPSAH